MVIKLTCLIVNLIALFGMHPAIGQSGIVAAGGDGSGAGGSVAYSIGQVDYERVQGEDGTINPGVQQPRIIIMVDTDEPGSAISAKVYPNPLDDFIHIQLNADHVSMLSSGGLRYGFFDMEGRLLKTGMIDASLTSINVNDLASGMLLLRITHDNTEVKTFKIFKSN